MGIEKKMAAKDTILDFYVLFSNTISKLAYSTPFKIQTCQDFGSPLMFAFQTLVET